MKNVGETWSLAGVNIAVEKDSMDIPKLRYTEHAVLDSTQTVIMLWGSGLENRKITGVLWSDLDIIQTYVGSGWVALVSDQGSEGNYFIESLDVQNLYDARADVPVYRITVDMRKQ